MDALFIIAFIAFIIFRTMADRKQSTNRNRKPQTRQYAERERPVVRQSPVIRQPIPTPAGPVVPFPTVRPFVPAGGEGDEEGSSGVEGTADDEGFALKQLSALGEGQSDYSTATAPDVSAAYQQTAETAAAFMPQTSDDLRRAVLWSEILQRPRCQRPFARAAR